jgi:hypothetical protein
VTILLAAAAVPPATTTVQETLLQYGAIGAILVVLLAFSYTAIKRERERADRAEADLRELNAVVREKVMPLAADLIRAAAELTQERRR